MDVLVDCAGAVMGGAQRFLDELTDWISRNPGVPLRLVGMGRRLSAGHLVRREVECLRKRHRRVVTLNNIGCVAARAERWLLLRNALYFPTPGEDRRLPAGLARRIAAQAAIVRFAARRADVVVVPSASMAERVLRGVPELATRLVISPHPVSPRAAATVSPGLVVCPVLFAPYKQMGRRLAVLAEAVARLRHTRGWSLDVRVTATAKELRESGHDVGRLLTPVGRLSTCALAALLCRAQVVYYPTEVESFGYPLAEARVNGQPIVAPDTAHSREIAGAALVGYDQEMPDVVAAALCNAVEGPPPAPEPAAFCPDTYFGRWLA